ncbi:unnamed protein product [Pedinophyceae sp. YPF-701]|nr:unnamed protein product [Pedinophyceae sp. YPF-701]
MSGFMAALGADVVALELQSDLAKLIEETARMNCWEDRLTVLNGLVAVDPALDGKMEEVDGGAGWRPYGGHRPDVYRVPHILLDTIVEGRSWDFIKLDIDNFEAAMVARLEAMISTGRVKVRSILVELNDVQKEVAPAAFHRLQQVHGYDIYRLNMHLDRRFINQKGWDIYAHYQDVGVDTKIWEEMFSVRLLRYVQRVRNLPNLQDWDDVTAFGIEGTLWPSQFLITKEKLLEKTRYEHVAAVENNRKPYQVYAEQNGLHMGPGACPPWAPCTDDEVET